MPDQPLNVDLDAAATALDGLLEAEDAPVAPAAEPAPEPVVEQAEEEAPPAPPEGESESTAAPEQDEEFLPRADLEALLEGVTDEAAREAISTAYKSFQSGFTKKSQEISELRRTFEGVDPDAARQAYDFVQNLASDRDFALQVHTELSQALEAAGLSPAQASAEASRTIEDAASTNWEEQGIDPENPLVKEIEEMRNWRVEMERREAERENEIQRESMIREIERQDAAIRRDNPSYEEEDMEAIYQLAASTQGDLIQAQEAFESLRDRLVTSYVAAKKSPRGVAPPPASASHSEQPVEIKTVNEAHALAAERFRQLMDNEDR